MPSRLEPAIVLRLGEKRAGQLQDLVGLVQLAVLELQRLDALLLGCAQTLAQAAVTLALPDPAPQRLRRRTNLASNRHGRRDVP